MAAAVAVNGAPVAKRRGGTVDLTGEWPEITVHQAVSRTEVPVTAGTGAAQLAEICRDHTVEVPLRMPPPGQLVASAGGKAEQWRPPSTTTSLLRSAPSRPHRDDPRLTEHWDLVAFGAEVGAAYSELTDPVDQGERLLAQSFAAAGGDPEAMAFGDDFVRALGYGMLPPTGGLGLGVDRLMMMLTDVPIRRTPDLPIRQTARQHLTPGRHRVLRIVAVAGRQNTSSRRPTFTHACRSCPHRRQLRPVRLDCRLLA